MSVEGGNTLKVDEEIVCRKNQDGTVVLMKMDESNNFYKVDGVAAEVWELLRDGIKLDEIYDILLDKYDVSRNTLMEDTENFLVDLLKYGMVSY